MARTNKSYQKRKTNLCGTIFGVPPKSAVSVYFSGITIPAAPYPFWHWSFDGIVDGGKPIIPVSFRKELGLSLGDTVVMEVSNGELRVRFLDAAIADVQRLVGDLVAESAGLADELIADRSADSAKE